MLRNSVCKLLWQVLTLATVMLFIGSLSTVAVPKLAGQLVDICIQVTQGGGLSPAVAKPRLNSAPTALSSAPALQP